MSSYTIQVLSNGQTIPVQLEKNQPIQLNAPLQGNFKLLDESGNEVPVFTRQQDNDTWIYVQELDEVPEIIVQHSDSTLYPSHAAPTAPTETTLAPVQAAESQPVVAKTVAQTASPIGQWIGGGLGLLAVGGLAAAAGGGGGDKSDKPTPSPTPKPTKPESSLAVLAIDDDNVITENEIHPTAEGQYTLTGKIDLSNTVFTKYHNRDLIRSVSLTIGNKTFEADYDKTNDSFSLTLNAAELSKLDGQSIDYTLNMRSNDVPTNVGDVKKEGLAYHDGTKILEDYYVWGKNFKTDIEPSLTKDLLSFDANNIIQKQNGTFVVHAPHTESKPVQILGQLQGENIANQTVDVLINQKHYTAHSDAKGQFSVTVSATELAQDSDKQIVATWLDNGKTVTDTASYTVLKPNENTAAGTFVSHHSEIAVKDMPYFMQALYATNGHQTSDKIGANQTLHITYHFNTAAETKATIDKYDPHPYDGKTFNFADSSLVHTVEKTFNLISYYANVKFDYSNTIGSDIDLSFYNIGQGVTGYAYYGGNIAMSAFGYYKNPTTGKLITDNPELAYSAFAHELTHSLGFKHAMDKPHVLPEPEANVGGLSGQMGGGLYFYDLIHLHYLYGVNPKTRAENNTYTFSSVDATMPRTDEDLLELDRNIYIWDGNGVDTFDASAETQGVTVNLTPGSWIYSGEKSDTLIVAEKGETHYTFDAEYFGLPTGSTFAGVTKFDDNYVQYTKGQAFIGYGTQLENLIGSNHNDTLTGNNADNVIQGLNGNDRINGGKGNDILFGDAGNDTLIGGDGDDRLYGGLGEDTLTGGAGNDTFVFSNLLDGTIDTITDFQAAFDKIELSSNIFSSLNADLSNFNEHIFYKDHTLYYDADGSGSQAAVAFARLENDMGSLSSAFFVLA